MPRAPFVERASSLDAWAAPWDALVDAQDLPSPFLRSWWLESVASRHRTGLLLVRAGSELLGGVALGVRQRSGITSYGAPGPAVLCPDHLDVVAAPGSSDAVVDALAGWFAAPGQRRVDLRGVVPDSLLHRVVGGAARPDDLAPYQSLTAGGEGFLASRSANLRRNVRRGRRRLAEVGLHHRRLGVDELHDGFHHLRRLHTGRPGRDGLLAQLPLLQAAVAAGAARGEARVDVLASDADVVAVTVGFEVAGRLSLYQVARSTAPEHASAGTVLLADVIEDAERSGAHEVDLLRGDEDYKRSFADDRRSLVRVRAARGAVASALVRAEDTARAVRARAREQVSARRRPQGGIGA